jgi:hypothetical protein
MSLRKRGFDHRSKRRRARKAGEAPVGPRALSPDEKYRVGPGHPPREFQFKPGQSGNPKGAEPKSKLLRDLRVLYARAMNKKVNLPSGERDVLITKFEAGLNKLARTYLKIIGCCRCAIKVE